MKKEYIFIGVVALVALFLLKGQSGLQATLGTETMTRTVPSQVNPNSQFTVTYTAIGTGTGRWGVIIDDSVDGGCSFPSGTSYQDVLLSDSGTTRSVTITTPASGTCTFTGNYMFDEERGEINFPQQTVSVCSADCSSTKWAQQEACATSMPDGCGGTCTRQINQNTPADTSCDGQVSKVELMVYIGQWKDSIVGKVDLMKAITAWIGGS